MGLIAPADLMFLLAESTEQPMHVGGLQVFDLPPDTGPDFLTDLYAGMMGEQDVQPLFMRRARRGIGTLGQWTWEQVPEIDLEYHVRHSALPQPGRIRELLALASRLHGSRLDRSRPLWEAHLIEGLQGNQFAIYSKMHHALIDGVASYRLMARALSEDPSQRGMGMPWQPSSRPEREKPAGPSTIEMLTGVAGSGLGLAKDAVGLPMAIIKSFNSGLRDHAAMLPYQAPKTMLNGSITAARRVAAQSWPLDRLKAVRTAYDATLNEIVLAMCSGALRQYLQENDGLPDAPLVAMVPVSLRAKDHEGQGNAVGAILANLATHLADPKLRLELIKESTQLAKDSLSELSPNQVLAMSALNTSGVVTAPLYKFTDSLRPPFNVTISNVPGPPNPMFWNGARLSGLYPISIPTQGQALNITCTTYAGTIAFGLTGCRTTLPHLQRLLDHLETALVDLEQAAGI